MNSAGQGAGAVCAGGPLNRALQGLLVVTVVCVFVPFWPVLPLGDSEASWAFGLNQAVAQGMVFGRDILYTLGPYAAMYTRTYHPATDQFITTGALYLGLLFATVLVLLTGRSRWFLLLAFWLVLAGFMFTQEPLFLSYPLLVGVYCCRLLHRAERHRVGDGPPAILILALFSAFGLLPLVKGSYLVLCGSIAMLVMLVMALHRKWAWAIAVAVSLSSALAVFWTVSGQPVAGLPRYLAAMVPVISGYSDAMARAGSARELACYLVAATTLLGAVLCERSVTPVLRLFLFALFFVTLLIAFKGGFVRHDGHAVAAAASLLLAALVFALVFPGRRAFACLALCTLAWIYIDTYTRSASLESTLERIAATYTRTIDGLARRITASAPLERAFGERLKQLRRESGLPRFEGTSDIYSFSQSYLIASGNTWNPRPVFQSYAAYTAALAGMNRDHLLGDKAPDHLFFKLEPIDRRLPSLEDGPSWPAILKRYRPGGLEHGYLYLHRAPGDFGGGPAGRALPGGGAYAFGQEVGVPDGDNALVFADIALARSIPGALAGILYKPGEITISLRLAGGGQRSFRLVPPMARAGFLISPLVESTVQFARLYGGLADLSDKKVESFTLKPAGYDFQWQDTFEVSFRTVEPPPAVDLGTVYTFADAVPGESISDAKHCDGNLDAINGSAPAPEPFNATGVLEVDGWLAVSAAEGILPDAALVVLEDGNGTHQFFQTSRTRHPWAGKQFGKPGMDMAGFTTVVDVSGMRGDYTLGLALAEGGRIRVCPGIRLPGSIAGTGH